MFFLLCRRKLCFAVPVAGSVQLLPARLAAHSNLRCALDHHSETLLDLGSGSAKIMQDMVPRPLKSLFTQHTLTQETKPSGSTATGSALKRLGTSN
jgi:hypothetical protein